MLYLRKYGLLLFVLSLFTLPAKAQSVYKTPSGEKYHLANCRMVKNVSEKITPEKAIALNLQPCKICHPQDIYGQRLSSTNNKARGQGTTVQCKGRTKAGTRCKHMTAIANGYCFQHNPD